MSRHVSNTNVNVQEQRRVAWKYQQFDGDFVHSDHIETLEILIEFLFIYVLINVFRKENDNLWLIVEDYFMRC